MKKSFIGFLSSLLLVAMSAMAQQKPRLNVSKTGLAIEGYDPVAYFTENKAIEGKKSLSTTYQGITYRFSSAGNKAVFAAHPEQYQPQYGGWCAYAMGAKGEKVEIDPETFKIINGKLYLFYNKFLNNTLKTWNKDETRLKAAADQNWTKVSQ
ncbi:MULTISPECIES: YHS domain-containing (seleno)protein [Chitinophaga]|uniref:YHS domain-containing (seleno)protein n=1 Tax=Chitinophaga TaxID=79328 RepID=UPI000BAECEC9|nr:MULTISPECIES: YHS domain-containing (seleno)protein [Chitinophaga]ASZ14940.1 YHS domain protein [Chitinophaga sp. MD30]